MIIILKRVFYYFKGHFSNCMLTVLIALLLGLSFGVVSNYMSASSTYMNILNEKFPPIMWLVQKYEEPSGFNPSEDVYSFMDKHPNISNYEKFENGYIEIYLYQNQNMDSTAEDINDFMGKNSNYVVHPQSNDGTKLITTLQISIKIQNIILIAIIVCVCVLFTILFILNMKKVNKDNKILLCLGETSKNINKQFFILQAFTTYIPLTISSIFILSQYKPISLIWINSFEQNETSAFQDELNFLNSINILYNVQIFILLLVGFLILYFSLYKICMLVKK